MGTLRKLAFLGMLFCAAQAWGEEIQTIYLPEGVLALPDMDGYKGAFPDILNEAARRLKRTIELKPEPWPRAQQNGRLQPGAAVTPLTRVAERENQYVWVAELFPLNVAFIVPNSSKIEVARIEDLKDKRIGVLRGSISEVLTKKFQLPTKSINAATNGPSLAKLLQSGRIEGWLIWDMYGFETLRSLNMQSTFKAAFSHTVGPLYLASNMSIGSQEITAWRDVLHQMKKDGTISGILRRYYGDKVVAAVGPYSAGTPTDVEYSK